MTDLRNMIFILLVTFHSVNNIGAENLPPAALSEDTLEEKYGQIKYAALIFRHGDRTPTRIYPTDPYQNYSWPVELGELTNQGKQREYDLGKYFQPRYKSLTTEQYKSTNVIAHSSFTNRCLMSAELFLAGYFLPNGSQVWNKELLWQPIPVGTAPSELDNVISMRKPCRRRDRARKQFYVTNPLIREICANYSDTFRYIQTHSKLNMDCSNEKIFDNLISLQDTLLIESTCGLELPKWTKSIFPEPLTSLRGLVANIEAEDHTFAKLSPGVLLSVIVADMFNTAGLDHKIPKYIFSETRPLHLFSGHDGTIVTLLRVLKMYPNINPPYGATLGFELRSKGNLHYVTLIYEDSIDHPPKVLEIPGCSGNCTLESFMDLISPLIPKNWDSECLIRESTNRTSGKPSSLPTIQTEIPTITTMS